MRAARRRVATPERGSGEEVDAREAEVVLRLPDDCVLRPVDCGKHVPLAIPAPLERMVRALSRHVRCGVFAKYASRERSWARRPGNGASRVRGRAPGNACVPGTREGPLGTRASRPHGGEAPGNENAGGTPAFPGGRAPRRGRFRSGLPGQSEVKAEAVLGPVRAAFAAPAFEVQLEGAGRAGQPPPETVAALVLLRLTVTEVGRRRPEAAEGAQGNRFRILRLPMRR